MLSRDSYPCHVPQTKREYRNDLGFPSGLHLEVVDKRDGECYYAAIDEVGQNRIHDPSTRLTEGVLA